jgi:hypothetical protein
MATRAVAGRDRPPHPISVSISIETRDALSAIDAKPASARMQPTEGSMMWVRLRNVMMLVVFAWWTTSVVSMDPMLLEWVAHVVGG